MGDDATPASVIVEEDAEPETLDRAVRGLRRDLIEIDSVSTEHMAGPDQPGAKGDIGLLGTIAVSTTGAAVPAVITLLARRIGGGSKGRRNRAQGPTPSTATRSTKSSPPYFGDHPETSRGRLRYFSSRSTLSAATNAS